MNMAVLQEIHIANLSADAFGRINMLTRGVIYACCTLTGLVTIHDNIGSPNTSSSWYPWPRILFIRGMSIPIVTCVTLFLILRVSLIKTVSMLTIF